MKKQHKWLILCLLLAVQSSVSAQPGGWMVDAARYQYSMTAVAQIRINGVPNHLLNNHLAVFRRGQIRGYATPVKINGQAFFFLNLYSNEYKNDTLYFRAYVGADQKIYESAGVVLFKHHQALGKTTAPLSIDLTLGGRPLIYSLSEVAYVENTCSDVLDVQASDNLGTEANGLTYSIAGGADAARFSIHPQTGLLKWAAGFIPDFEAPGDANSDNRYEIKVRVMNAAGLQDEQTVTVTVLKPAPPPALTCPVSLSIATSDDGTGNCATTASGGSVPAPTLCASYNLSYQLTGATTANGIGAVPAHQIFEKGMTLVTYTRAGIGAAQCSFAVTVSDDEVPGIVCPANLVRGTDPGLCSAVLTYTVTGSDNCPGVATDHISGGISGTAFPKGITTVQWKSTDAAGLTKTCTFTVTVNDTESPAITCPVNIARNTDPNVCSAVTTYANAQFSDNCPGATLKLIWGLQSGAAFPKGITILIWQTTDAVGLTASCTFTVTVSDPQGPTITCPANIVRNTDLNQCAAVVSYTTPVFLDNCPGASLLLTSPACTSSGSTFPKGTTTVAWRATDAAGASVSCSFSITVSDAQAPTMTCPANQSKATAANLCTAVVTYPTPVFTDNCTGASVALLSGPASGAVFPKGITTVTWKTIDGAGLTRTCTFTVTVTDGQLPTITCPANMAVNTDPNLCTAVTTYTTPVASDNCTGITLSLVSGGASGSSFAKGPTTVTWKATDGAGLTKTCTFRITVNDTQAPAITCPANLSVTAAPGQCSAVATYSSPSATDNCAVLSNTLLSGLASGSVFPKGTTTNLWKATDNSGLTKTCAFTVTVSCGTSPETTMNDELRTMNYELRTMNEEHSDSSSFIVYRSPSLPIRQCRWSP